MIVKETRSVLEIKKVLCRPDVYETINNDDCPPIDEYIPTSDAYYVGGYLNDIFALMVYHYTDKGLKCHIHVLPEFRREYARQFTRMALKIGEAKNANIYTEIPECYPKVRNFAKKFGFKDSGTIEASFIKNGEAFDVNILRLSNV